MAIRLRNAISPNCHCKNPYTGTHTTNATTPANGGAFLTKIPKTDAANIPGEIYPWNS